MAPKIEYYCPCLAESPHPPPPHVASSAYSFHPLHNLFFCEECDAVRCNRCVLLEVSGYYCPNCLFEVPSASVRAEKNRCVPGPVLCSLFSVLSFRFSSPVTVTLFDIGMGWGEMRCVRVCVCVCVCVWM